MTNSDEINSIIDRIALGKQTEEDIAILRQLLSLKDGELSIQLGKYNVNIGEGKDIHIGDRTYVEWNEEAIQKLLEVIQEKYDREKYNFVPLLPKELPQDEYIRFKNLLAAGRWREANELTRTLLLKAAKAEKEGWLSDEQIEHFPCSVLKVIDDLWLLYSKRQFGFSVQKHIFQDCEKNPQAFGERVGWCVQNTWISVSQIIDTPANAPEGHLPWGVVPVITMDNAALDAFVKAQRSVTKALVGADSGKLQLIVDFIAFGSSLLGDRVDKNEIRRSLEYELSHDEAWWEGKRLEELKIRKLFSLLAAYPNL